MKSFILSCLGFLLSFSCFSQEEDTYIPLYGSLEGDQYVYADTAYVRSLPGTRSTVADTLLVGDNVTILSTEKVVSTIKGILAPWTKIRYNKKGLQKEGYIWSGLLTLNAMRRGETKFIYGVERVIRNNDTDVSTLVSDEYIIGLKVVSDNQLMDAYKFKLDSRESINLTTSTVRDGRGLNNTKNIIALTFSGEACAIPTLTYRFGWTGIKLYQLPIEEDVADASVFYYDEELIFPADKGGKGGFIIKQIKNEEATEKVDKKGEPIFKTTREQKIYKWDGIKFIPS
jgi:hypothetical protein